MVYVMAKASKNGLMVAAMKVNGGTERPMVAESCTTQTAISTKETGSMTRPTATERTLMPMVPSMWAHGRMTSSMGKA